MPEDIHWSVRLRWLLFGAIYSGRPLWGEMATVTKLQCTQAEILSRMTAGLRALHGG